MAIMCLLSRAQPRIVPEKYDIKCMCVPKKNNVVSLPGTLIIDSVRDTVL